MRDGAFFKKVEVVVQVSISEGLTKACWCTGASDVDEDWPEESDWTIQRNTRVNGTMMRRSHLVCGVASPNPNLKQQNNEKVKLMTDSGSQSTAYCVDFLRKTTRQTIPRGRSCGTSRIRKLKHTARKLLT